LLHDGRPALLSGGNWIGPKLAESLVGAFPTLAEREVDEYGDNTVIEAATPLVIPDDEREQLIQAVLKSEQTSHAGQLLESMFEVTPVDSTWVGDLQTVMDVLRGDERLVWLGADRF